MSGEFSFMGIRNLKISFICILAGQKLIIMEYKIILGNGAYDLEKQVNSHIMQGWQLQGGVMFSSMTFCQAMVKPK